MKDINYATIIKLIIGDDEYKELLVKVSRENNEDISIDSFFDDIFNKYCFIILMLGMSKKIEIEKYKFKTNKKIIEKSSFEIAAKYEKYVRIVEDEKFKVIKEVLS